MGDSDRITEKDHEKVTGQWKELKLLLMLH